MIDEGKEHDPAACMTFSAQDLTRAVWCLHVMHACNSTMRHGGDSFPSLQATATIEASVVDQIYSN